jgi:hypothetical protein
LGFRTKNPGPKQKLAGETGDYQERTEIGVPVQRTRHVQNQGGAKERGADEVVFHGLSLCIV